MSPIAKVHSAQVGLLEASLIAVETDVSRGLYQFSIVGLPDKAVEEARDRVSAAIKHSGFTSPKQKNQKVVISLSPAGIKKEGAAFDLPIALSYLLASGEASFDPKGRLFVGELSLSGEVLPVRGALPIARSAAERGITELYVPSENAPEAALVTGLTVFPVRDLRGLAEHLDAKKKGMRRLTALPHTELAPAATHAEVDFSDVRGQEFGKHGLLLAAAGGHNVGMYGPPGAGKTLLARAFAGILPPLGKEAAFEVTSIHSVAGTNEGEVLTAPPFRSPHHTSSYVSLVGGGSVPRPGEITLAHRGVLFLDEFPEFDKRVIESLRQPLEDGHISVSRSKGAARFPARFILVAAMNPCPCGFSGTARRCTCRPGDLARYRRKLSGPLVDRIDLWISVDAVEYEKLGERGASGAGSAALRASVAKARARQRERFEKAGRPIALNSEMNVRDLSSLITLAPAVRAALDRGAKKLALSARGYHKTLKLARTIADLEGETGIGEGHVLEALQFRPRFDVA